MTAIASPQDLDGVMDDADFAPLEALLGEPPDQRAREAWRGLNNTLARTFGLHDAICGAPIRKRGDDAE
jgi:hypothetical protein